MLHLACGSSCFTCRKRTTLAWVYTTQTDDTLIMCKLASTTELAALHAIIACSMITAKGSSSKPRAASEGSDICVHAETTLDLHLLTYTLMVRPRTHVASVYRKPKSDTDAAHDTLQDFCRRTQQITETASANKSRGMYVARAVRYTRNIVFGSSRPGPCLLACAEGSIATVATPEELLVVRRHFGTCGTFRRNLSNSRGASTNSRGEPPECDASHRVHAFFSLAMSIACLALAALSPPSTPSTYPVVLAS